MRVATNDILLWKVQEEFKSIVLIVIIMKFKKKFHV